MVLNEKPLLEVKHLKKFFPIYSGIWRHQVAEVKAVDDISFRIEVGEIVGMVGESGSGKSTAARAAIRLIEPTSGEIEFLNTPFSQLNARELRLFRRHIQMIFQDPLSSLNPRKTILENIGEPLFFHMYVKTRREQIDKTVQILDSVGLNPSALYKYPHQFSGGQQQRISIGRAIALHPQLIVCDEAVSSLDVSIQAQILNLLYDLKNSYGLSYLFISHDLSVVRNICDRVLVIYQGKIVENAPIDELFFYPKHPYTQMLLASIPKKHPLQKKPSPPKILRENSSNGCPFYSRCPVAKPECAQKEPPLKTVRQEKQRKYLHEYRCIH